MYLQKNEFNLTMKYLYSDVRLDFSVKGLNLRRICNDLFTSNIDFILLSVWVGKLWINLRNLKLLMVFLILAVYIYLNFYSNTQ